jgi:RimJ/RimL family protein N-acetyltransferase
MSFGPATTLENEFVRLEPLSDSHTGDLTEAVKEGELWRAWYTSVPAPDSMADAVRSRLAAGERGEIMPWTIIDVTSGRAIGMSSYLHLEPANRRLEIGSTWIGRAHQGSAVNPAAKLLLLDRAFGSLSCIAVEFRTHWHNRQSRAAIEKLGAKQDGVLRNHIILPNGTVRDTVVYSIIETEWPTVRFGLTERLRRLPGAHGIPERDSVTA